MYIPAIVMVSFYFEENRAFATGQSNTVVEPSIVMHRKAQGRP